MKVQELAVEVARHYLRCDASAEQSHHDNVQRHLRRPVQALTAFLLLRPIPDDAPATATTGDDDDSCQEKGGAVTAATDDDDSAADKVAWTEPNVDAAESSVGGALDPPTSPSSAPQQRQEEFHPRQLSSPATEEDRNAAVVCNTSFPFAVEDWRKYVVPLNGAPKAESKDSSVDAYEDGTYERLDRRTKARLEAFLEGVTLAVSQEPLVTKAGSDSASSGSAVSSAGPSPLVESVSDTTKRALSALRRTGESASLHSRASRASRAHSTASSSSQMSQASSSSSDAKGQQRRYPQIRERALVTRLELYARSLWRARQLARRAERSGDAPSRHPFDPAPEPLPHVSAALAAPEPARSMRVRAQLLVDAFVDTIDNVHQQSTVLSRLLKAATRELLAVDHLSEPILKFLHRLISNYIQSVSFASLAFLSSPEASAHQHLSPKVVQYLKYLQSNWRECVSECELERMLALSIDADLRNTLKNIEFRSIGHLLEVCQGYRTELSRIALAPDMRAPGFDGGGSRGGAPGRSAEGDRDAIRQALRDLQREVITVNGSLLPPVTSRKELISLLSQTLNSRTLASAGARSAGPASSSSSAGRSRRRRQNQQRTERNSRSAMDGTSGDELTTSDYDTDLSGYNQDGVAKATGTAAASRKPGALQRRRSFRLSTIDFLTKRLLLAACRTGTFGDAYFVVRDLFGDDDVEVVPSQSVYKLGRSVRPGSIEISVKLASLTIKCHGSFDVYPKSMVGDCEPLIQLHTTTTETIGLQEVRACDTASQNGSKHDEYDSDDDNCANGERGPVMVVQERLTEKTGWRYLSIRPALYEKYEEFSTPS